MLQQAQQLRPAAAGLRPRALCGASSVARGLLLQLHQHRQRQHGVLKQPQLSSIACAAWGRRTSSSSDAGPAVEPPPPPASSAFDPVRALKQELGMQSNQLDAALREAIEAAIARLGYRVTVGQVAAAAGVKLSDADRALKALAYDSLANLEVSEDGQVVYAFAPSFISTIRSRSWSQRLRPLLKKVVAGANWLARASFGAALVASAVLVWMAVVALSSSRDSDRRGSYSSYGGSRGFVFIDPTDLWLIWDPYYGRHSRERVERGEGLTFVEAVFSFVFGDGDPNMTFAERRWRALGAHIQRLGGVASAEELAPFLDPPPLGRRLRRGAAKYEDESFVLPALIRFNGEPFVDGEGRLLYRFPDLQVSAGGPSLQLTREEVRVPLEKEWAFSAASPGQLLGTVALGAVNVVGVITLSTLLVDPVSKLALYRQGLGFVLGLLPYLQAYAASFFTLPLLRSVVNARRNAAVDARNDARVEAAQLLQSGDAELAAKSASARKLGSRRVIGRQEIVYTTEQATSDQANAAEEDEFDRRLGVTNGRRQDPAPGQLPAGRGRRFDDVFGRRRERLQEQQQREREAHLVEVDWEGEGDSRRGSGSSRRRGSSSSSSSSSRSSGRRRDDDWDRLDRW